MPETQPSIFEETDVFMLPPRRALLPWWIIFFSWFFIVISPIQLILALVPYYATDYIDLSMFGIVAKQRITLYEICWDASTLLTIVVSYGLLKEKSWAVNVGILDALSGIPFTIYEINRIPDANPNIKVYWVFYGFSITLLIIYLWKLFRIRKDWSIRQPR